MIWKKNIKHDEGKLKHNQVKLNALKNQQNEFILAAKHQSGVIKLEKEISDILSARKKFIAGFDDVSAINIRKQTHRKTWLMQQG